MQSFTKNNPQQDRLDLIRETFLKNDRNKMRNPKFNHLYELKIAVNDPNDPFKMKNERYFIKIHKERKLFYNEKNFFQFNKHPNIVKYYGAIKLSNGELGLVFEVLYFTMTQLMTGGLKNQKKILKWLIFQCLKGLEFLHNHPGEIAHRHISPNNLMIDRRFTLKIIDFENSKCLSSSKGQTTIGTKGYQSPEVIRCDKSDIFMFEDKDYTTKIDIFNLGLIAYEAFYGKKFSEVKVNNYSTYKDLLLAIDRFQNSDNFLDSESNLFNSFLKRCLKEFADERSSATELLNDPWFEDINMVLNQNKRYCKRIKPQREQFWKDLTQFFYPRKK